MAFIAKRRKQQFPHNEPRPRRHMQKAKHIHMLTLRRTHACDANCSLDNIHAQMLCIIEDSERIHAHVNLCIYIYIYIYIYILYIYTHSIQCTPKSWYKNGSCLGFCTLPQGPEDNDVPGFYQKQCRNCIEAI